MATMRTLPALAALVLGAACAAPMQLPAEFVELKERGEGWRAITSDDARVRVRDVVDPTEGGTAEFWVNTLRLDLLQRGYEQTGSGETKNAAGGAGRWLEFAANVRGERVGYLVAVWTVDPWWPLCDPFLRVVEFAARDDVFRARVGAVREALGTVGG